MRRNLRYGTGSATADTATSGRMLADRSPALFLDPRPATCTEGSRRGRFGWRTATLPAEFAAVAEVGGCFALDGGRFADSEGDGDDLEELTPLVWMPGGTGLLAFVGMVGGGTAVIVMGAMAAVAAELDHGLPGCSPLLSGGPLPSAALRVQWATRVACYRTICSAQCTAKLSLGHGGVEAVRSATTEVGQQRSAGCGRVGRTRCRRTRFRWKIGRYDAATEERRRDR